MSAFTTVIVRISKTNTKSLTVRKKSARNLIYLVSWWIFFESKTDVYFGFEGDFVIALGLKEERNCLRQNFLLDVRHVVCFDFPASTTREYIWHFRWTKCMATVGSAIVCDRLRSTICYPRSSAIACDHMETSLYILSPQYWEAVRFLKLHFLLIVLGACKHLSNVSCRPLPYLTQVR